MLDEWLTGLVEVRRCRTRAEANGLALVLLAVGIGCRVSGGGGAARLLVASGEVESALDQLARYERENRPPFQEVPAPSRPAMHGLDAALAYCAVLLFFFAADERGAFGVDWGSVGAADSVLILGGAWWRTVTALCLHADLGHLMGNVFFGAALSLFVAHLLGWGVAWLAILATGVVGNAFDAAMHAAGGHVAVGASTALFGALGLLAGHRRRTRTVSWRGGIHRWAPLAGGILLLVDLGTGGERTAVGAHVLGFAVGCGLGLALGQAGRRLPKGPWAQRTCGAVAVGVVVAAWAAALYAPGP